MPRLSLVFLFEDALTCVLSFCLSTEQFCVSIYVSRRTQSQEIGLIPQSQEDRRATASQPAVCISLRLRFGPVKRVRSSDR